MSFELWNKRSRAGVGLVFKFIVSDMEDVSLCNMAEAELRKGKDHLADLVCWEQGATTSLLDTDNRVPGNRLDMVRLVVCNNGRSTWKVTISFCRKNPRQAPRV